MTQQAFIHCRKAHRTAEGWFHPKTGVPIETDGDGDIFCLYMDSPDGQPIVSFLIGRTALEQVQHGIDMALTREPVRIRRADG